MWAKKNQTGFTIVETLIVLAVTGVMFLSTVFLVSGQVSKYIYKSSMNSIQTSVRDTMNDVQTGFYPDITTSTTVDCGSTSTAVTDTVSSSGGSDKCVIAGKRLTFTTDGVTVETLTASANESNPFSSSAHAADVFKVVPGVTDTIKYPGSIEYAGIYSPSSSDTTPVATDATFNILYTSFNPNAVAKFVSGSQSIGFYNDQFTQMSDVNSGNGRTLCFVDGDRKGSITVGYKGSLTVTMSTDDSIC